jgi:hypothetical protein
MHVGILLILTGRYRNLGPDLIRSCEKKLAPDARHTYFIFGDRKDFVGLNGRMIEIPIEPAPWPAVTLRRYEFFQRSSELLSKCDVLVFLNANARLVGRISVEDLLPSPHVRPLFAARHSGYYNTPASELPFERNPASAACVSDLNAAPYVFGGINGGMATDYLSMSCKLSKAIREDTARGIVARWHDESHFNRYVQENSTELLPHGFVLADGQPAIGEPKIFLLDKARLGGHSFFRGARLPNRTWPGYARLWASAHWYHNGIRRTWR